VKLLAAAQEKLVARMVPDAMGQGRGEIGVTGSSALGMLAFAALAFSPFYFARKPLETAPPAPDDRALL
jgi:hypothetical protein